MTSKYGKSCNIYGCSARYVDSKNMVNIISKKYNQVGNWRKLCVVITDVSYTLDEFLCDYGFVAFIKMALNCQYSKCLIEIDFCLCSSMHFLNTLIW